MINISSLGNLTPVDPLNLSDGTYKDMEAGFRMPDAGRYTLRAPDEIPSTAFSSSQKGALAAQIDPVITGPTSEGLTVRFTKIYSTVYERKGVKVSGIGDYLRACGFKGQLPGDPQAQADAIAETAGRIYEAELDWEARHRESGFTVKGQRNFPKGPDGRPQPWVEHPTEKDPDTGEPLRLRANLVVRRFIAAS